MRERRRRKSKRGTKAASYRAHDMSSQKTPRCDFHLSPLHSHILSFTTSISHYPPSTAINSQVPNPHPLTSHSNFTYQMSVEMQNDAARGSSSSSSRAVAGDQQAAAAPLSRYESQKRRDWNTFGQYLKNQAPPVAVSQCNFNHVLEFLRYLDQFGKTKVHLHGCIFFGQPDPPAPCTCPLRQAWGSLDALIGRLRAAFEEHGGSPETNPFGSGAIRVYLREVKECQAKARGIPYTKKKKKKRSQIKGTHDTTHHKSFKQLAS